MSIPKAPAPRRRGKRRDHDGWLGVRPDAWERTECLAAEMGWRHERAFFRMCKIWLKCQRHGLPSLTSAELCTWAEVRASQAERFLEALQDEKVEFVSPNGDGTYLVRGIEHDLDRIAKQSATNSENAKKRWSKEAPGKQAAPDSDTEPPPIEDDPDGWRDANRMRVASAPKSEPDANCKPTYHVSIRDKSNTDNKFEHTTHGKIPPIGDASAETSEPLPRPRGARGRPPRLAQVDPEDAAVAAEWAAYGRTVSSKLKIDPGEWANAVRLMRERDNLTHQTIREMLAFVSDPSCWWHRLAASLPLLRRAGENGQPKHENIRGAMERAAAAATSDPQRDHAIRLADQALTVVMGPLNALPWSARSLDESGAYLREHIPAEALEVFGETSENWRTWFRSTRNSVERGGLPAARAQLRDSILAVMRRRDAAQVEAPVDAAPSPPPEEPPPDEPPLEVDEVSLIEAANNAVEKVIVAAYTPPERKSDLRLTLPLAAFQAVDELAGSDWRAYLADVRQRYEQNPFDDIGLEKLRETILGKLQGGEP